MQSLRKGVSLLLMQTQGFCLCYVLHIETEIDFLILSTLCIGLSVGEEGVLCVTKAAKLQARLAVSLNFKADRNDYFTLFYMMKQLNRLALCVTEKRYKVQFATYSILLYLLVAFVIHLKGQLICVVAALLKLSLTIAMAYNPLHASPVS